jgi:hypothetical protein
MNSSQLLYKISGLQYSIRKKEVEYSNAVQANDQPVMDLHKEALQQLKEALAETHKQFDAVQTDKAKDAPPPVKKTKKWPGFFTFRAATNKK